MSRERLPALVLLGLCACQPGPEDGVDQGDTRLDHAGSIDDAVESEHPRTCGVSNSIFTVWQDDRGEDGVSGIWFNGSRDRGLNWLPADVPVNASELPADATEPDIACTEDRVYVTWRDARDGELENGNIYFNWSDDGGKTWQDVDVALDADPEGEAMSLGPRIAASSSGVYVAWFDARNGAYDIYVNSSTDGGDTWLANPVRVDTDDAGSAYSASPVIAVDGEGLVLVAWEDSRDGYSDIYVNHSLDYGLSFDPTDTRLDGDEPGAADSFAPSLVLSDGHAYIAWHDNRATGGWDVYDALVTTSDDGGLSWDAEPQRVQSTAEGLYDARYPTLAALGEQLHVAWQDSRAGGYDIYYRSSLDGGGEWRQELRLDRDSEGEAQSYAPRLLVSDDELVVASWQDRRNDDAADGFNDLYYTYSRNGGQTWDASDFRINSNAPGSAYAIEPWMGRTGEVLHFVWADGRSGSSDIYYNSLQVGASSVYIPPPEE